MAEIVENRVEKTLDELNLLVEFGIFNEAQAKELVAKRQNFEYTLRRRTRSKLDFLKYIKFECNLLESIEKYKKTIISDYYNASKRNSDNLESIERKILLLQAKKLNDVIRSRAAHISSLFRKLTTKFQFDKKLWLAYIEFAKKRNWNSRVTALYWRLLRVSGEDATIWTQAASHEIEINKAFDTARGLYLRALRHHPKSSSIWAEYFKMELKFMDVVSQRAQIVFKIGAEDNKKAEDGSDIWADTMESTPPEVESDDNDDDDEDRLQEAESKPIDTDNDAIISGQLPKVVYENAVKSLEAPKEFVDFIVKTFSYILELNEESKGLLLLKEHIYQDLTRRLEVDKDPRVSAELLDSCRDLKSLKEFLSSHNRVNSSKRMKTQHVGKTLMDNLYECYENEGIETARSLYKSLEKSVKNQTLSLYVGMIQIEYWGLEKDKTLEQLNRIRDIYDKALMKFGKTRPKLWYEYLQFEHNNCKRLEDFLRINELYHRAQLTLEPSKVDKLIEKYTIIQANSSNADLEYSDYSDLDS